MGSRACPKAFNLASLGAEFQTKMLNAYAPVLLAFVMAAIVGFTTQALAGLLAPRRPTAIKGQPFECGIPSTGAVGAHYSVRFFLVAVLFLLFDVEAVFLFPWAVVFRDFLKQGAGVFLLVEMSVFLGILLLGLFYVWKKGALRWE